MSCYISYSFPRMCLNHLRLHLLTHFRIFFSHLFINTGFCWLSLSYSHIGACFQHCCCKCSSYCLVTVVLKTIHLPIVLNFCVSASFGYKWEPGHPAFIFLLRVPFKRISCHVARRFSMVVSYPSPFELRFVLGQTIFRLQFLNTLSFFIWVLVTFHFSLSYWSTLSTL